MELIPLKKNRIIDSTISMGDTTTKGTNNTAVQFANLNTAIKDLINDI